MRFRVSEPSVVSVAVRRGGRAVRTLRLTGSGARGVTLTGLRAGRYAVVLRATDLAGNRSRPRTVRVMLR